MAGTYSAGTAFLQVVPSFLGVQEATKAEAAKMGAQFEGSLEHAIPEGMKKGAKASTAEGAKAGEEWAGSFSSVIDKRLRAAFESLPKAKPEVETTAFDRRVAEMRVQIETLRDLHVKAEIDDGTFFAELEHIRAELRSLKNEAPRLEQFMNLDAAHQQVESLSKLHEEARRKGYLAGSAYGGAFSDRVHAEISGALKDLPQINLDADATDADFAIATLVARLNELRDKSVSVHMDDKEFLAELTAIRADLAELERDSTSIHLDVDLAAARDRLRRLAESLGKEGRRAGEQFAGAFRDTALPRLEAALKSLPAYDVKADVSQAERALGVLRTEIEVLKDAHVNAEIDDATFLERLRYLQGQLEELARTSPNVTVRFNATQAAGEIKRFADTTAPLEGGRAGDKAGERFAGAFRDTALPRLEAALKALPTVNIDADITPAERALGVLRTEIEVLKDAHVNTAIDDATFLERLRYLQGQLEELARTSPEVTVRFNATQAAGEIKRFAETTAPIEAERAGDRAGGAFDAKFRERLRAALATLPEIRINAGTEDADIAIAHVREQLATLQNAHINAELDDSTALLQIAELKIRLDELAKNSPSVRVRAEAAAAAAELAAVLELAHRVDKSDPKVEVKANVDSGGLRGFIANIDQMGHAANTSGSRLGMLVALGASLGTVLVPAAAAAAVAIGGIGTAAAAAVSGIGVAVLGFTGIGGAVGALNKYQQDTAKSAASLTTSENRVAGALDAVSSAEASLANTREQVASASQRAAQTITDAQRGVTDAERTALQARKDLTQAYEDARRAQEDMTSSIRSNSLAQRQANLDVAKAKKDLDAIMANPRATDAEREQARITYEQRVLQLDDITVKQKRLQADKAAADKAGIDGSTQVQSAQEKVRAATENVAKAQQRLGQTIEEQRQQERQGAFQIASAQQSLANAYRQVEQASVRAGVAGGSALSNLQVAMDQLGPSGQRFAKFLFGLKGDFLSLRDAAQGGMLPGVERGIQTLLPYFASLQRFIGNVANQMGSMFEDMGRQMQLPTWQKFFGFIKDTTVPSLQGMFTVTMTVTRGLAALFLALTPFNGQMGQGLIHMAEGFAKWAETLGTNSGFQRFLGYVRENGPHVLDLLEQMAIFIGRLVAAAAPIGSIMTKGLEAVLAWVNAWPMGVLEKVVGVLGSFLGVLLLMNVAVRALKIALLIGDFFKTFADWFKKGSEAVGNFRDKLSGAKEEVQTFGFGFQAMGNAVQGTTQKFMFFEGMSGRIMNSVRNGMARYAAAVTTATGEVGLLARATELAGAAMGRITGPAQAAMARYAAAVTTATGEVGLLARAQELAGAAMGRATAPATAMVERYRAAVTTASGQVSLFGRAAEVAYMEALRAAGLLSAAQERVSATASRMASMPAAAMARYTAGITTASGQVGLLARATEVAGGAGAMAMGQYTAAVTTASGRVSLFGRAAEVAYMEALRAAGLLSAAQERVSLTASRMASMPAAAMARYTAAITTATGEVGLLARGQELVGGAAQQVSAAAVGAWTRITEAIQTAVSRTGALIASQDLAGATMARIGAMGSAAMSRIGSAAGTAAVKADAAIFTAGKGIQGAAGLASKGLGALAGMMGGPVGIAMAAGTIAWGIYSAHVAEVKARIDGLSQSLNSYANTMKGGLTPATIEQARAALEQDKSLRDLVETTRRLGINNGELVRGINGEKTARDEVIKAIDGEIEREKQKAKEAFGFGDWMFGFGKKEYSQHISRISQLEEERKAFAKRNTENAAAGKLTEDLTAELNAQKQMVADVGAAFSNTNASADIFKAAIGEVSASTLDLGTKMNVLEGLAAKVGKSQLDSATKAGLFRDMLNNIGSATELHGPKFDALSGMFNTIATSAIGAKDKTDLLKQSLDLLYGSSISQNEADEALIRTQGDLETQLATSSAGFDLQTASTLAQKLEIVKNRDALEAALLSTREKYVADVAAAQESGNVTLALEQARTAHDNATTSIIGQIDPTYRNSAAVQDLVNRYGAIPKDVKTKYSTDESFTTLYNQLRQVSFMQAQVKEGASPERAQALWNQQEMQRQGIFGPYYVPQRAEGGLIDGPWQGPKADNVLIRANPREFVQQVSSVDYYGVAFMDALNRRAIPKGLLPGFAGGGLITDQSRGQGAFADWPFKVSLAGAWSPTLQQALDIIGYRPGGGPAGPGELGAWIQQALAYAGVPDTWGAPLRVLVMRESGGNPRSINLDDINAQNGDPSRGLAQTIGATFNQYRDPRLSADIYDPVSNLVAALNYIKSRYGSIFNVQQADPNRPPMGYAAGGLVEEKWRPKLYDDGGLLQPGWNPPIYNATGRPEPVLNPSQWDDMTAAARGGRGAGASYHFQFRDTTLTPSKLRAMQAEDAVRAREGRAR